MKKPVKKARKASPRGLSKKTESEILKAYHALWDANLRGDMKTFASFLDSNFTIYGSAEGEIFKTKKEALKYYTATADQLTGKVEFRKRRIGIRAVGNTVVVNEQCDVYVLIEEAWTFYGHARVTSIFEQKGNAWKVVHHHTSLPDNRTEEGEQVATEKIKAENIQLRDAVKRRTIELENKNRELEIEAAVERVRAKALAMHKSEEIIQVSNALRVELDGLKIPGITSATITLQQENDTIRLWDITSVVETKDGFNFSMDIMFRLAGTKPDDWIRRVWDGIAPYFVFKQDSKSIKKTVSWIRKYKPEFAENAKRWIETNHVKNVWHPVVSMSHGKLSLDLIQEPVVEVEAILTKMGAAFDLAYKRFLDLQKAEAQAREAQIEAALERVRSRTMAMHHSDSLHEVIRVVSEQLQQLHIQYDFANFLVEPTAIGWDLWHSHASQPNPTRLYVPYLDHKIFHLIAEAMATGNDFYTYTLTHEEKNQFLEHLYNHTDSKNTPEEVKQYMFGSRGMATSVVMLNKNKICLSIGNFQGTPYTHYENSIFKRFGTAFEQAYIRFLDLQKAEAQAREAQIEVALERVRSSSLAMHKSEELAAVASVLFEQLTDLRILHLASGFVIFDKNKPYGKMWMSLQGAISPAPFDINFELSPVLMRVYNSWKEENQFYENKIEGVEFIQHIQFLKRIFGDRIDEAAEKARQMFLSMGSELPDKMVMHHTFFKNGSLVLNSFTSIKEQEILNRFAKAFDQTYTRFLDLQKAEAQAIEAQIEVALERVRARTMAMQRSDELAEAAQLLYRQFLSLGVKTLTCAYMFIHEDRDIQSGWTVLPDGTLLPKLLDFPLTGDEILNERYKAWKENKSLLCRKLEGEENKRHHRFLAERVASHISEDIFAHIPDKIVFYSANFSQGYLFIITTALLSADYENILVRFAKVFQQTYTRFLDLQKAEAQARESQIEAALERVRSRTMAMHNSNDLLQVINVLSEQLQQLGFHADAVSFITDGNEKGYNMWLSSPEDSFLSKVYVPRISDRTTQLYEYAIAQGKNFYSYTLTKAEKDFYFKNFFENTVLKNYPEEEKQKVFDAPGMATTNVLLEKIVLSVSNFHAIPYSEQDNFVIRRFASVFQQSYTRFLDLQKAETQAREAKIENALEKVRSRSLAMHRSDEIKAIVKAVFEQLKNLNFAIDGGAFIGIPDTATNSFNIWVGDDHTEYPSCFRLPFHSAAPIVDIWQAYSAGADFLSSVYSKKEKNEWFHYAFEHTDFKTLPSELKEWILNQEYLTQSFALAKYSGVGIHFHHHRELSPTEVEILKRFSHVFEQGYIRFLDLQKAEAQAREAQIEAALERVRSRTMAMQKPDELLEVGGLLYKELSNLGVSSLTSGYTLVDKDGKIDWNYVASPEDGSIASKPLGAPRDETKVMRSMTASWEKQEPFHVIELNPQETIKHQTYIAENLINFPITAKQLISGTPERLVLQTFNFEQGYLLIVGAEKLSDENVKMIVRFARVFEMTYKRFLDLQKAEEQAREAEIQLALERVRARTMAMHKSDELKEVVAVMYQQMEPLGFAAGGCELILCNEQTNQMEYWHTNPIQFVPPQCYCVSKSIDPFFEQQWNAWKEGMPRLVIKLEGTEKRRLDILLLEQTDFRKIPEETKQWVLGESVAVFSLITFKYGLLEAVDFVPLSEDKLFILERFSNVFEQTYTRFLDLQNAEAQAREAQIEVALERVRAASMAMHKSEELPQVALVLLEQLEALGVTDLDCGINIVDPNTKDFISYSAHSINESKQKEFHEFPKLNLNDFGFLRKAVERVDAGQMKFTLELKDELYEEIMNVWDIHGYPGLKNKRDFDEVGVVYLHVAQFHRYSSISTTSLSELSEEKMSILQRMAKTFGMSYTRFLDLQKAEAQARESQIEVALERLRSRTMAMQQSSELNDISVLLYKEIMTLGVSNFFNCGYFEMNEDEKVQYGWVTREDGTSLGKLKFPLKGDHTLDTRYDAWKMQKPLFHQVLNSIQMKKHIAFISPHYNNKEADEVVKLFPNPTIFYNSNFKHGYLHFNTGTYLDDEGELILIRFTQVFAQTYTRFLDLQKAETQAREAEIQLALERVRARTMAMHKSTELNEVVFEFFNQLHPMGIAQWGIALYLMDEERNQIETWFSTPTDRVLNDSYLIPLSERHPVLDKIISAYRKNAPYVNIELADDEKRNWDLWLFENTEMKNFPEAVKENILSHRYVQFSITSMRYGLINVIDVTQIPAEQFSIVQRFAKVFEQTYTRFLDLQKAEAQARESQIQLSLERVRARTMAMHKSEELGEVATLLYKELGSLAFAYPFFNCGYVEVDEKNNTQHGWMTTPNGSFLEEITLPLVGDSVLQTRYDAWKRKTPVFCQKVGGSELKKHIEFVTPDLGSEGMLEMVRTEFPDPTFFHCGNFSHGYLHVITGTQISEDEESLMTRFTQTFEMTYKRFLDLQKAEAQAREAQIEIALERIRARALAMHSSEELLDVAQVLREQMGVLGQPQLHGCVVELYEIDPDRIESWHAFRPVGSHEEKLIEGKAYFPKDSCAVIREMIERYNGPEKEYTVVASGEKLEEWNTVLATVVPEVKAYWSTMESMPVTMYFHCSDFSGGTLLTASADPISNEVKGLQSRAATVFDLAYRRFLDLKKAEAQAREAQIEAALERVRSRSMAMHQSGELNTVLSTMFTELTHLDFSLARCVIWIFDKLNKSFRWYSSNPEAQIETYHVPFYDYKVITDYWEAWEKKIPRMYYDLSGDLKKGMDQYLFNHTELAKMPSEVKEGMMAPEQVHIYNTFNDFGALFVASVETQKDEILSILERFGNVFNQSYTRFLDIQKAEAQAREAQIEAALERVRSRSMAMHKSDELLDVVNTVLERLRDLNLPIDTAAIFVIKQDGYKYWFATNDPRYPTGMHLPFQGSLIADDITESREKNADFITRQYSFEEKNKFFHYIFENTDFGLIPDDRRRFLLECESMSVSVGLEKNSGIQLNSYTGKVLSPKQGDVLKRFARVFEQAYTRFLDLQKAEAQAREAQIEAAVERVRAKALAMHKSEEIISVVKSLRKELDSLQIPGVVAATIYLKQDDGRIRFWDLTTLEELEEGDHFIMDKYLRLEECPDFLWFQRMFRSKEKYTIIDQDKEELKQSMEWIRQNVSEEVAVSMIAFFEENKVWHLWHPRVLLEKGVMNIDFIQTPPHEVESILIKMGAAFDLAHKRFLDLQKAEAQAREAQIEAALERVRSRTMGMQRSEDLREVVKVLYAQLNQLGFQWGVASITIMDPDTNDIDWWMEGFDDGYDLPEKYHVPYFDHKGHLEQLDHWKKGSAFAVIEISGSEKKTYDHYYFNHTDFVKAPENTKHLMMQQESVLFSMAYMQYGALSWSPSPISGEQAQILQRFAKVFEQTYTRFHDLQKAEAQAREAQIEAALERVRATTMAMHQSQQILDVIKVLCDQLIQLGFPLHSANIATNFDGVDYNMWLYSPGAPMYPDQVLIPSIGNYFAGFVEALKDGSDLYHLSLSPQQRNKFYDYLLSGTVLKDRVTDERRKYLYSAKGYTQVFAIQKNTILSILNYDGISYSPEQAHVVKRFAYAFEQSYVRFLDLQKAEAQAKEAQIEAALERVRSRAMAMRKSDELKEVIVLIFKEFKRLGFDLYECNILIFDSVPRSLIHWGSGTDDSEPNCVHVPYFDHPFLSELFNDLERGIKLRSGELSGAQFQTYFDRLFTETDFKYSPQEYIDSMRKIEQVCYTQAVMNHGFVEVVGSEPLPKENTEILERFTRVVDLTYTRFDDVVRAEQQAREAVRQASLDRVRAEIASMRTADDLQRITPLVWHELVTLGVPFFRCGVFIINEKDQRIHAYLSTPEGKSLAVLRLTFDSNETNRNAVEHWYQQKVFTDHWDRQKFQTWAKAMMEQRQIEGEQQYQAGEEPPESLSLQFIPFKQGMLYVGSSEPLAEDQINLVKSLADAFSVAYARYEDFKQLEDAKNRVETTLTELKATQSQLVQSEKMASLGELTAGIAHEIQNPLNFVNNFSEINTELIDELKKELAAGNTELAEEIADDIKKNEEKINHHGKRADGIVKGMLQHSRSNSGVKEPTNINTLADEYLRLAYHGLRAKDKSFNATMKTEFDESIGSINVVPQEMGRVILNLITNAFYAVNERLKAESSKLKAEGEKYEPTVLISTKKEGNKILISVKDNGSGIPQKVLDKIFQPFFTTKPTGQGTGLGLSMSYDIVKAHGGELKVETEVGVGSVFVISLPV